MALHLIEDLGDHWLPVCVLCKENAQLATVSCYQQNGIKSHKRDVAGFQKYKKYTCIFNVKC